jgi:hypothetical protein
MPLLLLLIAAVPVFIGLRLAMTPPSAARVASFARRHRLGLMVDDRRYVVAYLSHTRRRRTAGALGGYLAGLASALPQERITVEFFLVLAGWFVAAVVAEFRFRAPQLPGHDQAAVGSLAPGWVLRVPHALAATAVGVTALVLTFGRADERWWRVVAWGAAALACTAVVVATNRHVMNRPADRADDVTTAGRAVATNAVGAVTAVGSALAVSCLARQLWLVHDGFFDAAATAVGGVALLWTLGGLVIAWLVAVAAWRGGPVEPNARPLRVLLVVAALVAGSVGWAGYAWWRDRPPFSAAAAQATATVRFTDEARFEDDARALGITGLTGLVTEPGYQQFIGRVDLATPAGTDADITYLVMVIDKLRDRVSPQLYGTDGGGWSSSYSDLAKQYPWLSATAPAISDAGHSNPGSAVSKAASSPGPVTFVGSFAEAGGVSASDLMVVLVCKGPDGQVYWATRVSG